MTQYFPIIVEQESNGTFSAWVAGLPGVYAAANTAAVAKRAIRSALAAHLEALRTLGRGTSRAKAASSRQNGRKGGRPPEGAGR